MKATRIQDKVKGVGFEWDNKDDVWDKVQEELTEFKEAKTKEEQVDEFGDVLFSLINYARFVDIDPEEALAKTNIKFIKRFNYLEQKAKDLNKNLEDMTLKEMDVFWEEAKSI